MTYSTEPIDLQQYLGGLATDLNSLVPVPAQYDNVAYYNSSPPRRGRMSRSSATPRPPFTTRSRELFLILGPHSTPYTVSGFQAGDIPAPADYLGTGEDQVVAYQPSNGQFIQGTPGGQSTDPSPPWASRATSP